jgi:hypothetical protein
MAGAVPSGTLSTVTMRTSYRGLLVFLEVVVDEAHNKRGLCILSALHLTAHTVEDGIPFQQLLLPGAPA